MFLILIKNNQYLNNSLLIYLSSTFAPAASSLAL